MLNRQTRKIFALLLFFICGLFLGTGVVNVNGQKTYEVKPGVTVSGYQSDVERIVDAYERLMDRYISIVDRDMASSAAKLDAIDKRMEIIDTRLARIERALGIKVGSSMMHKDTIEKSQELKQALPNP